MSKKLAKDNRISLKAKGLYYLHLHLDKDFRYTQGNLVEYMKDSISALSTAVKELERFGYLKRIIVRKGHQYSKSKWIFSEGEED